MNYAEQRLKNIDLSKPLCIAAFSDPSLIPTATNEDKWLLSHGVTGYLPQLLVLFQGTRACVWKNSHGPFSCP